ncbi:MAG: hypothetical protein AB7P69_28345 [Candidatus Binatia bacterium]
MLKRVLGIINTISETVSVTPITNATHMTEAGVTTIMGKGGGTEIGDLTTTMIGILRLLTLTGLTMIDHIMIGRLIAAPPCGGRLIANDRKADRFFSP